MTITDRKLVSQIEKVRKDNLLKTHWRHECPINMAKTSTPSLINISLRYTDDNQYPSDWQKLRSQKLPHYFHE